MTIMVSLDQETMGNPSIKNGILLIKHKHLQRWRKTTNYCLIVNKVGPQDLAKLRNPSSMEM